MSLVLLLLLEISEMQMSSKFLVYAAMAGGENCSSFPGPICFFYTCHLGSHLHDSLQPPPPTLCRCSSLRNMLLVHITMVPNYCLSSGCPSQGPSFKLNLKRRKKNFHSMRQLLIQQINIEHLLCARHWSRCRGCCCE